MSQNTGPLWTAAASANARSPSARIALTSCVVQAPFVIGREDRRLVELLQGALPPPRVRRAAAEDDERGAVEVRRGDAADRIGDAGAGGHRGEARGSGQPARRLGGEHRGLLVARVDEAQRPASLGRDAVRRRFDAILASHRRVVHREDVGAGEGEDRGDACRRAASMMCSPP